MELTTTRIAQRAGWINSLFAILLISSCLILSQRLVATAAYFEQNLALSFLRQSFIDRVGSFYQELAAKARAERWSSFWLGIEGSDGIIVGQGNQLDPDPPYKSFRVTLYQDDRTPWFEVSAQTEVIGTSEDEAKQVQAFIDQRLTTSRRGAISDVLRQLRGYTIASSDSVDVGGVPISFSFLPIFAVLVALAARWQLQLLIRDENELGSSSKMPTPSRPKAHVASDDLLGLKIDPFARKTLWRILCGYVLITLLTGWEPNLYFGENLSSWGPSPRLRSIVYEGLALALIIGILRSTVNAHRS